MSSPGMHARTHAQTDEQVKNITPPVAHRTDGGGIEIPDRQTGGRAPVRCITFTARRGQRQMNSFLSASSRNLRRCHCLHLQSSTLGRRRVSSRLCYSVRLMSGGQWAAADGNDDSFVCVGRRLTSTTATRSTVAEYKSVFSVLIAKFHYTGPTRARQGHGHGHGHGLFCGETPLGPCGSVRVRVRVRVRVGPVSVSV